MSLYTTAGSKLYIGSVLAAKNSDFVAADFTAVEASFKEVTSMESMGSLGDASRAVPIELIGEARDKVLKGTRTAGNMEIVCGADPLDEGQIAMIAAERTPHDYAFKVELNDKPATGGAPKNSVRYYIAKVMSQQEVYEGANNVRKMNFSLAVNSNILRVDASAT
ncbi:hypothetical protein [Pararhizobium gei]|uniref:hypothetical protein n=1 Tax=Pararhizobium gei TaxID=1395951 RepID=UPI0023DA2290|nr:hypothetical protein [Rhizobium gei]